jgi:hypothetical protein
MIRIAISQAAFDAIAATLALRSVAGGAEIVRATEKAIEVTPQG